MEFFRTLSLLNEQPAWALAAGLVLLGLAGFVRSRAGLACGALWLAYGIYEYGMKMRILCTGECNIRIDLLVIYPVLVAAAVLGLVAIARAWTGRKRRT